MQETQQNTQGRTEEQHSRRDALRLGIACVTGTVCLLSSAKGDIDGYGASFEHLSGPDRDLPSTKETLNLVNDAHPDSVQYSSVMLEYFGRDVVSSDFNSKVAGLYPHEAAAAACTKRGYLGDPLVADALDPRDEVERHERVIGNDERHRPMTGKASGQTSYEYLFETLRPERNRVDAENSHCVHSMEQMGFMLVREPQDFDVAMYYNLVFHEPKPGRWGMVTAGKVVSKDSCDAFAYCHDIDAAPFNRVAFFRKVDPGLRNPETISIFKAHRSEILGGSGLLACAYVFVSAARRAWSHVASILGND